MHKKTKNKQMFVQHIVLLMFSVRLAVIKHKYSNIRMVLISS